MKRNSIALLSLAFLAAGFAPALALAADQAQVTQFTTQLRTGSSGDLVAALQALLAADETIYPEGTTNGIYGPRTTNAVKRFQKKHGLAQVGNVGPMTLKKLNELLAVNPIALEQATSTSSDGKKRVCAIVPPGHLIAPGWLKKNKEVVVPTCQTLPPGIVKQLTSTTTTTTATTTPVTDTKAPIISYLSISGITISTATISWLTNEPATGKIYYATSSPLDIGTAAIMSSGTLTTTQSFTLTGLATNTLYRFMIEARDAAGNTASTTSIVNTAPPQPLP